MESGLRASRLWFPLVGAALALMACGNDEGGTPVDGASTSTSGGAETIAVELQFEGRVRDDVFSCSETYAVGSASTDVAGIGLSGQMHGSVFLDEFVPYRRVRD